MNSSWLSIRSATRADAPLWEAMRCDLWPDEPEMHRQTVAAFFAGTLAEPLAVLLAEDEAGGILGFAELSVRTDIPGFEGERTGYVEGLFILPSARAKGVAQKLLRESQTWVRQLGCTRFASDREDRIVVDRGFQATSDTPIRP